MTQKKNTFRLVDFIVVIVFAAGLFWVGKEYQKSKKESQDLEVQIKDLKSELDKSDVKIDSIKAEYQKLEKVANFKDSLLTLSLKRTRRTPIKKNFETSLDLCLEAREIDHRRIKALKGLDVEHEIKENNFEQIVKLNEEYRKSCAKKSRKSFGIGFGVGLLVGLLIP